MKTVCGDSDPRHCRDGVVERSAGARGRGGAESAHNSACEGCEDLTEPRAQTSDSGELEDSEITAPANTSANMIIAVSSSVASERR